MIMSAPKQGGFTLMEVLVAMGVLAIALGAIIQSVSSNTDHASYLRDRTLAHWVAMNRAVEAQSLNEWPSTGTRNGTEEMAGHQWYWQMAVVDSGVEDVRRLEITVKRDKNNKQSLAFLVALLGKPVL